VVSQAEKAVSVTVLETWHGKLTKGEQIHIAGLPQIPITVSRGFAGLFDKEPPPEPKKVGGERIVLFLKPLEVKPDAENTSAPDIKRFRGASFWGKDVPNTAENARNAAISSAVWFEDGKAYAFMQMENPGPSELHPYWGGSNEEDLKKSALAILAIKGDLEKAKSVEQPEARVAALLPFTKKGTYGQARSEALVALGKCGKPALPALKEMVGSDGYNQSNVIDALAEAAGTDAGLEITAILEKEFAFWKTKAPELEVGWWNSSTDFESYKRIDKLRDRYGILHRGLWLLTKQPYPPSRELVTQIRDLWMSLPQLGGDKPEQNQIVETCEKVLKVLDEKDRP
jgi:hypothetical protein